MRMPMNPFARIKAFLVWSVESEEWSYCSFALQNIL